MRDSRARAEARKKIQELQAEANIIWHHDFLSAADKARLEAIKDQVKIIEKALKDAG